MGTIIENYDPSVPEVNIPKVIMSLFICFIGVCGNLLAIFVVVVLKEYKKSVTHWYVLHLAIADTIFLLTQPFKVSEDINIAWIYPEWLCKVTETILFLNYYASVLFLVVMSVDRYIAVCKTFSNRFQTLRTRFSGFVIAGVVWLMSFIGCTPVYLYSVKRGQEPNCFCTYEFPAPKVDICEQEAEGNETILEECRNILPQVDAYCTSTNIGTDGSYEASDGIYEASYSGEVEISSDFGDKPYLRAGCNYENEAQGFIIFLWFNFVGMFIVPLLIMTVCYGLIIWRLTSTRMRTPTPTVSFSANTNSKRLKTQRPCTSSRSDKDRRRVTVMCAALVSCFVVCWLPFHAIHLAKMAGIYNTSTETCKTLHEVGSVLAYLNSALNPYLYSFLATNFARRWHSATDAFRATITRRRRRHHSSGSFASTRPAHKSTSDKNMNDTITTTTKINKCVKPTEGFTCVETTQALNDHQNDGNQSASSASSRSSVDKTENKQTETKDTEKSV